MVESQSHQPEQPVEKMSVLFYLPLTQEPAPPSFDCGGRDGRDGCVSTKQHPTRWQSEDFYLCEDCMEYYLIEKGMMLEAVDILTSGYVCVATIEDFDNEGNVRIHFDGWTNRYDFWCQRNHPNLAPPGTCKQKGVYLHEPSSRDDAQWIGPEPFNWEGYFKQKKRRAVSKGFFDSHHSFWGEVPNSTQWKEVKVDCMSLKEYDEFIQENEIRGMGIKG